jgi:hypothetical protein
MLATVMWLLLAAGGATPMHSVATDPAGLFRFERVPPGTYNNRAEFPGFTPATSVVRVAGRVRFSMRQRY